MQGEFIIQCYSLLMLIFIFSINNLNRFITEVAFSRAEQFLCIFGTQNSASESLKTFTGGAEQEVAQSIRVKSGGISHKPTVKKN